MALRARTEDVEKLVGDTTSGVTLFIAQANVMVDDVLLSSGLAEPVLALIETYLAAHYATLSLEKGALAEQSMGEAKDKYHNIYKAGLNSTRFGQQAIVMDRTGALAAASAASEKSTTKKALFSVVTSTATGT